MDAELTLCIPQRDEMLLLGKKKRGFGKGRWNGFGGKIKPGESPERAMRREAEEEAGITPTSYEKVGDLEFQIFDQGITLQVHLYRVDWYEGEVTETEEMSPRWFSVRSVPLHEMWVDDRYWLPHFVDGRKFRGSFYLEDEEELVGWEIEGMTSR